MRLPFGKAYKEQQMQELTAKFLTLYAAEAAKDDAWLADYKNKNISPLLTKYEQVADMNTPEKKFEALVELADEVDEARQKFFNDDHKKLPSQVFIKEYLPHLKAIKGYILTGIPLALGGFILTATVNPVFALALFASYPVMKRGEKIMENDKKLVEKLITENGLKPDLEALNPYQELAQNIQAEMDKIIANHLPALVAADFEEKYPAVQKAFVAKAKQEIVRTPEREAQVLPKAILDAVKQQKLGK
jgi:hypothetical protein